MLAALVAFAHFLAFFVLTAALVLQLVLIRESPEIDTAKRIQRADRASGLAALLLLLFGFLRVFLFEKGGVYYFDNHFFQIKLGLFAIAGLISIYPTLQYLRWNREIKQGLAPNLTESMCRRLKRIVHWQLIMIVGILLCASMMAQGIG